MLEALKNKENWQLSNTVVRDGYVYLHGNELGHINELQIFEVNTTTLISWPTRTTISRLRSLGVPVCLKKGAVYLGGRKLE
jgi:hypothetical protein